MKNKKNTYLLLVIVLCIWGAVVYRFMSFKSGDNTETIGLSKPLKFDTKVSAAKEDIKINVHYRDPFLGKTYSGTDVSTTKKSIRKPKNTSSTPPPPMPLVIYKGFVSDKKDNKKVYMISINGKNLLMAEKQSEEGITIISGNRKELIVSYKGKRNKVLLEP